MLLLIVPARDGRYNAYICRDSDCQIEPLGPDVFDVVSGILEVVLDIITVSVLIVSIEENKELLGIKSSLHSCWDKITVTSIIKQSSSSSIPFPFEGNRAL